MAALTLPVLDSTRTQQAQRLLADRYGVGPRRAAESAGLGLAWLAKRLLGGELADRPVVVLAGRGAAGSGGLAAARYLLNEGAWGPAADFTGAAAEQLAVLQALDAPLAWAEEGWELPPCDLVIDAIAGCGLRGAPRGTARRLIELANSSLAPVVSLAAPSGLDLAEGRLYTPHVRAAATLIAGLPQAALLQEPAQAACGDLYLAGSGAPPAFYADMGFAGPPLFAASPVLPVDVAGGKAYVDV